MMSTRNLYLLYYPGGLIARHTECPGAFLYVSSYDYELLDSSDKFSMKLKYVIYTCSKCGTRFRSRDGYFEYKPRLVLKI